MEGERLSLSRFDFQKRDAWLVLDANASRSSAVVSQRSKTCRGGGGEEGGKGGQDGGGTVSQFPGTGNAAPGSVNPVRRRRRRVAGNCLQGQESEAGETFHWRRGEASQSPCNQSIDPSNRSIDPSINQSVDPSIHQ